MRVVNKKLWVITITLLVVIECVFTYLSVKSYGNKDITEIKKENKVDKEMFSMYVEQEDGSYKEYIDTNLFTIEGYKLDIEKSSCVDNKGNIVNGALSNSDNKISVSSNRTSYCYLYFSIKPWCNEGETASECLLRNPTSGLNTSTEAGMYRYQGNSNNNAVVNNYICFGTTVKSNCIGNTDVHMYRIIGIKANGQMKLIKKESLNTTVLWYNDSKKNIEWPDSLIFTTINGNEFLLSETYVPTGWESKLATTTWKYGDFASDDNYNGPTMYDIENPFGESTATNRFTKEISAKIGLWYIHDYHYSYASGGVPGSMSNAKTAWIHLSNNDIGAPYRGEWTMSRYGFVDSFVDYYAAMRVDSSGKVFREGLGYGFSVRPVFYLTSDIKITGGTGTSTDPFIIN